jgi:hypothetical protein
MGSAPQSVSLPVLLLRPRTLGQDLAPPRQLYTTLIPASLSLVGIMSWTMGDEPGLVLASIEATVVALFTLWEWLFRRAPTRFSTLLGMALLLGYGAGTLNTWLTLPRGGLTLGEIMGLDDGVLARGLGAVLLTSACLYFLGEIFEKPVFGRDFRFTIDARTRALIYVGTVAMLGGYATHRLIVGGATSSEGHVSVIGVFLFWFYPPLTAVAVAATVTAKRNRDALLLGASSLILLAIFGVMGRRCTIYTSMEILLMLGFVGFKWREKIFRNILLVLALITLMAVGGLTFMLLRLASVSQPHKEMTTGQRFEAAGKLVKKGGAITQAEKTTQINFQSRTFVLAFLANILDASSHKTPGLGQDAFGLLQGAVPRVFYPDKYPFSEEGFVDQQYGFGYGDEANSVLTAGATDFSLAGMIFYPIILVFAVRLLFDFCLRFLRIVPLMFVTLALIYVMLQTEVILNGYFETIRDSFLFGVMLSLFMALPRISFGPTTRYH